jgi:thioredoxin-related protein
MKKSNFLILFIAIGILSSFRSSVSDNKIQLLAKESNKNVVIYFCGSDWCSICHKFKKNVLAKPSVDSVLKNDFVYYVADFPQRTKLEKEVSALNSELAEKLNTEGLFPKLVIADADLKILKEFGAKTLLN